MPKEPGDNQNRPTHARIPPFSDVEYNETLDLILNLLLLVNLLRVIMCTSVHPRLALLTGTMANALDDLFHTAILTCVLMLCFAGIGTWRFGSEYEQYADFETTLQV